MANYTTTLTIFRNEFTNPILHDDEWYMMLWGYYCTWCTTIAAFIMDTFRRIWSIEFATIFRDATTKLHDVDFNFLLGEILIYGSILVLVWIAGVFVLGSTDNKDATENTKDPIENTEGDEPSLPFLPTGVVSTATPPSTVLSSSSSSTATPPTLVSEPTGPHTAIEQLRDIRSLLKEVESKVKELESSITEESSTFSANSTTDDSTTDESASNEEQHQNYERIERNLSKAQKAQDKANARKWSDRQRRR